MMQQAAKLRSPSTRKLMTGLANLISRQTRPPRPSTKRISSVCTRQNGSPSQSHSCPLLSITSQVAMASASSPRPMPSKFSGRFFSFARSSLR